MILQFYQVDYGLIFQSFNSKLKDKKGSSLNISTSKDKKKI